MQRITLRIFCDARHQVLTCEAVHILLLQTFLTRPITTAHTYQHDNRPETEDEAAHRAVNPTHHKTTFRTSEVPNERHFLVLALNVM